MLGGGGGGEEAIRDTINNRPKGFILPPHILGILLGEGGNINFHAFVFKM